MPAASQIKALIVDDQASIRQVLANSMAEIGFTNIAQRKDGKEALEYLDQNPTHLVISDFNMPVMDGLALLRAVRSNPKIQKVAFIILTGEASKDLVQEAVKAGVNNFLAKPYTVAKLREVLEKVFGPIK
ncbi:MAG: response regulator [Acetobacter sp.]|jgi:two-component system chemotaxis response regulator CheY|uniref:Two-component system chemotaxis response regulator CheY n=3 Tax=Acetobacter TaxID=434 RepID=A0A841QFC1_9PROT|nr:MULTISPECIES: response regulator [Acetobacter]MBB6457146.1 two-component system chemotaxis response regulator CheY [Acetobacter lovaniensis]MBS0989495.1 response regulator [Acetobacter okinawensis]MCH4025114.1 response regulator [Acetobacter fabarum]MCH4055496.1 response regulator [Acetobacter fabarum]MCH4127960.1 response regulator [Acetobacter fabarum]